MSMKSIKSITQISHKAWYPYLLLGLITVLAAVFRFYKLGEWSFWIDEIYTLNRGILHYGSIDSLIRYIPPAGNWVPLSVILTGLSFNIFDISEWSARLVPALIGILTIPILYFPFAKIFGKSMTLIALFLLAISPWHINWSQNARGYTNILLLYTLALISFYYVIEKDRPFYLLYFYILTYIATSERMMALFIIPVVIVYLFSLRKCKYESSTGMRARNILLFLSPALLLVVIHFLGVLTTGESIIANIATEFIDTYVGKPVEKITTQAIFMSFEVRIPILIFGLGSGVYWLSKKTKEGLLIFLGAFLPYILVILLTPFMFTEERYAFLTLPGWLLMNAYGIKELYSHAIDKQKLIVLGIVGVLVFDAIGANLIYLHTNNGNRRDWRGAYHIIQEYLTDDDMIISTWAELGEYYLKRDVVSWNDIGIENIKKSEQKIWMTIIPDMTWFTGTQDIYWWVQHNCRLIAILYLRTMDNTNIEIYLFDPDQNDTLPSSKE